MLIIWPIATFYPNVLRGDSMDAQTIENIKTLSLKFRAAIDRCKGDLPINFSEFPRGSCGDASLFLGKYLKDNGFSPVFYVVGIRGNQSHAWLEYNGLIIDITADQFNEWQKPVLITSDYHWHRKFKEEIRRIADYLINDEVTVSNLSSAYNIIISHLVSRGR